MNKTGQMRSENPMDRMTAHVDLYLIKYADDQ